MRGSIFGVLLVFSVFFLLSGCGQRTEIITQYACPDGIIVSDSSECTTQENSEATSITIGRPKLCVPKKQEVIGDCIQVCNKDGFGFSVLACCKDSRTPLDLDYDGIYSCPSGNVGPEELKERSIQYPPLL